MIKNQCNSEWKKTDVKNSSYVLTINAIDGVKNISVQYFNEYGKIVQGNFGKGKHKVLVYPYSQIVWTVNPDLGYKAVPNSGEFYNVQQNIDISGGEGEEYEIETLPNVLIHNNIGVSEVFLSTSTDGSNPFVSGTYVAAGTTVYGFARLAQYYKPNNSWELVSGQDYYLIGSKISGDEDNDFGEVFAQRDSVAVTIHVEDYNKEALLQFRVMYSHIYTTQDSEGDIYENELRQIAQLIPSQSTSITFYPSMNGFFRYPVSVILSDSALYQYNGPSETLYIRENMDINVSDYLRYKPYNITLTGNPKVARIELTWKDHFDPNKTNQENWENDEFSTETKDISTTPQTIIKQGTLRDSVFYWNSLGTAHYEILPSGEGTGYVPSNSNITLYTKGESVHMYLNISSNLGVLKFSYKDYTSGEDRTTDTMYLEEIDGEYGTRYSYQVTPRYGFETTDGQYTGAGTMGDRNSVSITMKPAAPTCQSGSYYNDTQLQGSHFNFTLINTQMETNYLELPLYYRYKVTSGGEDVYLSSDLEWDKDVNTMYCSEFIPYLLLHPTLSVCFKYGGQESSWVTISLELQPFKPIIHNLPENSMHD